MKKEKALSEKKMKQICEWFFDVIETHRKLTRLEDKVKDVHLCGIMDYIHIYSGFDNLVWSLIHEYGKDFVGEIVSNDHETYFRYCEYKILTLNEKGESNE